MTSQSSANRKWAAVHEALQDLLQEEGDVEPGPQLDQLQVLQDRAVLYLKYLQILRSLAEVYEQLVQPQRRQVVRMVLDGLVGRLLELKMQMVDLDSSEFHCFDELLLDLKMTPKDLEIPVPRYVPRDQQSLITSILETQRANQAGPVRSLSLEEAVRLLQASERARQGRIRAQFIKELVQSESAVHRCTWKPSDLSPDQAAIRIQRVWRGHSQRRRTERLRAHEMLFLGMVPAQPPGPGPARLRAQQASEDRRLIQDQHEEQYQAAGALMKQLVVDVEGRDMKETLQEQIRLWFIKCRDVTGRFPEFPDEGSASLFTHRTPEQVLAEQAAREEEQEEKKKKKKKKEEEEQKGPQKKNESSRKKKKKKNKETEDPRSCFLSEVVEGDKLFSGVWRYRDDRQSVDVQLLREEKRQEVEKEVRLQVDELMKVELRNLKLVVDKTKEKKKKAKKKKKKKSKKKKKKEKDLTADRSLQSLCEELILEGLLIQPMNIKLSDYIGEYSYLGSALRQVNADPMPSLSDVRQLVALYAVLPLGTQVVLEKFPELRTLLLAGPSGVGKKMLVQAICSETRAHLFHLSPAHLSTRYAGTGGAAYLLHLIFKVAGELQPSVVWIEDAEKIFSKKRQKKNKEFDPGRLKKILLRSVKTLSLKDRVLLVGTTRRPFDADAKTFCKVFKKILLIPRPDYSSRLVLWRELLQREGAEPGPALDLSSLAKITDGFTQGHILQAVRSVLVPRRRKKLRLHPLTATEFIQSLSRMEPVYREEEEAFKVWFRKTPLGRRKAKAAKTNEEEGGVKAEKKKQSTKDKKKKKKKQTR